MQVKLSRLNGKIERTKERLKSMEGIIRVMSPPVYVWETEDVMRAEKQYYRLRDRLESYQNKSLSI